MPVVITPESELGKELAKWEKPYVFQPFPRILYKASRRPDGVVGCVEGDDRIFGGTPGAAEMFSARNQKQVEDEDELLKAKGQGWRETPREALELFEEEQRAIGRIAAQRNYEDRLMSEKAQAEAKAAEDATPEHVPVVEEKPRKRRGRPRRVA